MNYAIGCAFNLDLAFLNFDNNKLKMTCEDCIKENNNPHKSMLVKKIFRESVRLILADIIANNATFELPTGAKKSDIHIVKIDGEDFKKARLLGKFSDIDFLKSWFSGYLLMFNIYNKGRVRQKPIYVNKMYKDLITENTNKGKQYC